MWRGGGGDVESCWRPFSARLLHSVWSPDSEPTKLLAHPKDKSLGGEGVLNSLCPLQVTFQTLSMNLILLQFRQIAVGIMNATKKTLGVGFFLFLW
jgi:hypothetical protein